MCKFLLVPVPKRCFFSRDFSLFFLEPLDFHAHEEPFLTGHIKVMGEEVERREVEANPAEAFQETLGLAARDVTVKTDDDTGAAKSGFGKFDESHKTIRQAS